ncbi:MAG: DNA (cytosine-5)-methyltransferase 1, partial [Candidatus Deianiraeaceae bacterium]
MKNYSITSLFSGCGGLDLGFNGGFNFLSKEYRKLKF